METMKHIEHIGTDGILQIVMPTNFQDTSVEVVVVVQPLSSAERSQGTRNHGIMLGES